MRGTTGLVVGTGVSAIAVNAFSAQQYVSIVVPGMTLRNLYDEYDLDGDDLSQAIEPAGTPAGALVPWHAGSVFMAGAFGVSTLAYAPLYFFGFLSPLVLFGTALTGVDFATADRDDRSDAPVALND